MMLENDSNKNTEKTIRTKEYSAEGILSVSGCNITNRNDVTKIISKLEKIVNALEDEVVNLKQHIRKKIN